MPALASYLCIALSLLPVVTIVLLREAVLLQRQVTIQALGKALIAKGIRRDEVEALPSFEFVKFKYFLRSDDHFEGKSDKSNDYKAWQWAVGSIPLIFILFFLYEFCFCTIFTRSFPDAPISRDFIFSTNFRFRWIVLAGFAGAQANMYGSLIRSINNFDLSPATFLECFSDILIGITSGLIVYFCAPITIAVTDAVGATSLSEYYKTTSQYTNLIFLIFVLLAFSAAYYPDVLVRNLIRIAKLSNYKTEKTGVFSTFKTTPIEIIDGIDSSIRRRLEDFYIFSVQNLAAANPLMLYVETPFGIYQTLDWVAQAQLISLFGDEKIQMLWGFGIRSIFDLERFARDPMCRNKTISRALCQILIPIKEQQNETLDWDSLFVATVNSALETSHVHRLRQIVILLSDRIGSNSRRLPFMPSSNGPECCLGCACSG